MYSLCFITTNIAINKQLIATGCQNTWVFTLYIIVIVLVHRILSAYVTGDLDGSSILPNPVCIPHYRTMAYASSELWNTDK